MVYNDQFKFDGREFIMEKIWTQMYDAAKAVLNERRISEYVTCGEVSAAVCSGMPQAAETEVGNRLPLCGHLCLCLPSRFVGGYSVNEGLAKQLNWTRGLLKRQRKQLFNKQEPDGGLAI